MTPCPPRPQLERLLAEQLDPSEDAVLTRHVEGCPACQALLGELSGESLGARPRPAGSRPDTPDMVEGVIRRLKERPPALGPGDANAAGSSDTSMNLAGTAERPALPQVHGYEVLEEVGRGGMGVIYRARQQGLQRVVALKMLRAGAAPNGKALARLRAEAGAVARLQHANIVQVHEVGEHDGQPFFSMEFVAGGSLRQRLDGTPWPAAAAAALVETVARAVATAHARGIVHRDLKPANILLAHRTSSLACPAAEDKQGCLSYDPKVADFGLAKLLDDEPTSGGPLTQTGEVLGTPSYMAPEQARGHGAAVGPPVDVYALGAVLYELLSGRPPFAADTPLGTLLRVVHEEPVSVMRLCPALPRDLATVTMKCLEKQPSRRYATAGALADDLARFREGRSVQARPVGPAGRAWRWCRRNPAVAALLAALALVFAGGFGTALWQAQQAWDNAAAEAAARREADRQTGLAVQAEKKATALRRQAERVAALAVLDQGLTCCRQGEVPRGLLLLADSLEKADGAGLDEVQHAIRANLAAWGRLPLAAVRPAHAGPVDDRNPPRLMRSVRFSPDGKALLTVAWKRQSVMRVWDADTGQPLGPPMPAHTVDTGAAGFIVHFSPDGRALLTYLPDHSVLVWEATTGRPLGPPLPDKAASGHRAGFSPDGKRFYLLQGRVALIWDAAANKQDGPPLVHGAQVTVAAFRPDGKALLTACEDGTTCLWDLETRRRLGEPLRHGTAIQTLAFASDGETFLTADKGNTVRLWETRTGRPAGPALAEPEARGGHVHPPRFTPDGKYVMTQSGQTLSLYAVPTGQRVVTLRSTGHAWEPGGKVLGVIAADPMAGVAGELHLWDVARRQLRRVVLPRAAQCLDVQTGGGLVATGDEKAVALWDVATGKPVGPPLDHPGPLLALTFAPDGRRLLTCCNDATARLWEMALPLPGSPEQVRLWVEVLTGKELDEAGGVRQLGRPELDRRRQRLDELTRLGAAGR